jgi:hypothetical protein
MRSIMWRLLLPGLLVRHGWSSLWVADGAPSQIGSTELDGLLGRRGSQRSLFMFSEASQDFEKTDQTWRRFVPACYGKAMLLAMS